ncbi:MAG: hypothetical protein LCH74_10150 [Proteobacteria bacterium]|nr:hypothetical protein [Pseudomonadota bacterium]
MQIKIMADYGCSPLWWDQPDKVGNIHPEELKLSLELSADLRVWSAAYDATLNHDSPTESGFATAADELSFHESGKRLAERAALEMRNRALVRYHLDG